MAVYLLCWGPSACAVVLAHTVLLPCTACVCLQVIPRLNPLSAPTDSYVNADRERLLLRLDMYGLEERQVQGDGNCQVSMGAAREGLGPTAMTYLGGDLLNNCTFANLGRRLQVLCL